jgi:hypothetical protein
LDESNWAVQELRLDEHRADIPGADEFSPQVVVENNPFTQWGEFMAIHETNEPALRKADELAERLENYPILNDDDFSRREWEEAQEIWEKRYRPADRIEKIRQHRQRFEFSSFADLLGCVRGKYYAGETDLICHN